jgi:hypothetical protein
MIATVKGVDIGYYCRGQFFIPVTIWDSKSSLPKKELPFDLYEAWEVTHANANNI